MDVSIIMTVRDAIALSFVGGIVVTLVVGLIISWCENL